MKRYDYAKPLTKKQLRRGKHRRFVAGRWEQMGRRQLGFMKSRGLEPHHRLLDVACGPLRAGICFVDYLEPGNYYGIDINQSLLDIGYERELPGQLREKLPRDHLRATQRFDVDFGVEFDFALAQSLFTHIPLNDIRLCLARVAKAMKVGGSFYATFFEAPPDFPVDGVIDQGVAKKRARYGERNPFWYWPGDLEWAASFSPWEFRYIGDWNHPRGQRMVEFVRTQ
jgi:SAM-dependent methyltransferase